MKNIVLSLIIALSSLQPAIASEDISSSVIAGTETAEAQNWQQQGTDIDVSRRRNSNSDGDILAGIIIGGIIGGIIADSGRNNRQNDRNRMAFICYARDWYGEAFQGRGRSPGLAQQNALDACYQYSDNSDCRIVSCRRYRY